jgi:hypothetical protein
MYNLPKNVRDKALAIVDDQAMEPLQCALVRRHDGPLWTNNCTDSRHEQPLLVLSCEAISMYVCLAKSHPRTF